MHRHGNFFLFLLLVLAACDESRRDSYSMTVELREPGQVWNPCKDTCDGGFCIHGPAGSMCHPPCPDCGGGLVPKTVCGEEIIPFCLDSGMCILACEDDLDCPSGTICLNEEQGCIFPD